jgi:hypothetical protein
MSCSTSAWRAAAGTAALAAAFAWPAIGLAQDVSGQAVAVRAIVLGVVTSLADSGTLSDPSQPIGAGQPLGSIPGLVSAESLHSAVMGWTDQVVSEASLSNVALTVAGTGITADFLQSRALAVSGAAGSGLTAIEGLQIGGVAISPIGIPNQLISLPGLGVVLNEQTQTANGIVVNALRIRTLDGLTDVVVGSARAGL